MIVQLMSEDLGITWETEEKTHKQLDLQTH